MVATGQKGRIPIKVISTNNRGKPQDDFVQATVFECVKCGSTREFPDEWEKNYVLPSDLDSKTGRKKRVPVKNLQAQRSSCS